VAVWGCGPVGQFAIASAMMLGAARVIAIDRIPERLELARSLGAITVDYVFVVGVYVYLVMIGRSRLAVGLLGFAVASLIGVTVKTRP
jgi:predicted RNA methylase